MARYFVHKIPVFSIVRRLAGVILSMTKWDRQRVAGGGGVGDSIPPVSRRRGKGVIVHGA
jgi:hypothetical protein